MKKLKPCPSTHPTRDVKCWAKEHDSDEFHWAMLPAPEGQMPQRITWKDLTNA